MDYAFKVKDLILVNKNMLLIPDETESSGLNKFGCFSEFNLCNGHNVFDVKMYTVYNEVYWETSGQE